MPESAPDLTADPEAFSWEAWLSEGLHAFRRLAFRHDFGPPEVFWEHCERGLSEFLAAARVLWRWLLERRRGQGRRSQEAGPEPQRGSIDIEWE